MQGPIAAFKMLADASAKAWDATIGRAAALEALGHAYGGGSQYFSTWIVASSKP